jgi:Tfp pilus assembly protein PilF
MKPLNLIVISALLCQLMLVSSCAMIAKQKAQAQANQKTGLALLEAGQYLGALKVLLEADKDDPDDPVTNYYLGIAYNGRGMRDMALERFQRAVYLKEDYSEAHNYIGVIYMDMGQWEKAIVAFDQALKNYLYETPALALYNSGWAYYNLKNYSKALSQYQQALSKDSTRHLHPRIEKNIGLIYLKQSNFPEAKAHLEKSVNLNPSLYDAHFYLGETYLKINDNENARRSFRQVIKLAPQTPFGQKAKEYLQSLR